MSDVYTWDPVDNQNNSPPPDGAPEGQMTAKEYNDVMRAQMGAVKRWLEDIEGSRVTTGTGTAYSVEASQSFTAYYDGMRISFRVHVANTGPATLNVDNVGPDSLVFADGSPLVANDLEPGVVYDAVYYLASAEWRLQGYFISLPSVKTENALVKWVSGRLVSTAVLLDADNNMAGQGVELSPEAASKTLTLADNGKVLDVDTSAAAVTLTLPQNTTETLPEGFQCVVIQNGANAVTIATEGTDTIRSIGGATGTAEDQAAISIIKTKSGAPNEYWIGGSLG